MDPKAAPPSRPRRQELRADAAMAALILALGVFLAATGSFLIQRWHSASAHHQSISFEDQLGIAANTAGLIVIIWWVMSLAIALTAALLDRFGRTRAAAATGRFTPAFMRRLVLAAVGLQLAAAPLANASATLDVTGPGRAVPTAVATSTPSRVTLQSPPPEPGGPATRPAPADRPAVDPRWKPVAPIADAGPLTARHVRGQDTADAGREVTVRSGDSLWSITAAALGPFATDADIAREWPRLYASNRGVIGANPHFLRPGQVLLLPPGT